MKAQTTQMQRRQAWEGFMFVSPFVVGTLAFFLYPVIFSLYISFGEYTIVKEASTFEFLGWANYVNAFIEDTAFTDIFKTVVTDSLINTPLIVVFSLIIAIFLNKDFPGRGFFRTVYFLPFLLGTGYVMSILLGMDVGEEAMNMARGILLPEGVREYLGATFTTLVETFLGRITYVFWRSGVPIILFLSGLQNISVSLYESARVDGATEWEMLWKITLPMVSPIMLLVIVYVVIDSFSDTGNAMVTYFFDQAFSKQDFSYSAAISWVYFAFILLFVGLIFAVMKGFIHSEQNEPRRKKVRA